MDNGSRHRSGSSDQARILLLGCTKAKSDLPEPLPALQRYDGPAFRLVRRYVRSHPKHSVRIYVLSSEFGLISADELIPPYDRQMTPQRAATLQTVVGKTLDDILPPIIQDEPLLASLLVVLGKRYLSALAGYRGPCADRLFSCVAPGGQGRKLSILHDWLYRAPPELSVRSLRQDRPLTFRGTILSIDGGDVVEIARRALRHDASGAFAATAWTVGIDGRRVALKWLVRQVTGLGVQQFSTTDARRLMARLGIKADRV